MNKLLEKLACIFGKHDLEIVEKQIPWIALYKRYRCRRCSYRQYFKLNFGGWRRLGYHPTTMIWGPKVDFDRPDKYRKTIM